MKFLIRPITGGYRRLAQLFDTTRLKQRSCVPLLTIARQLVASLTDCPSRRADILIRRIELARTPQELWGLRSDVHECIALTHSQSEASQRIERVAQSFDGWIPQRQQFHFSKLL